MDINKDLAQPLFLSKLIERSLFFCINRAYLTKANPSQEVVKLPERNSLLI